MKAYRCYIMGQLTSKFNTINRREKCNRAVAGNFFREYAYLKKAVLQIEDITPFFLRKAFLVDREGERNSAEIFNCSQDWI